MLVRNKYNIFSGFKLVLKLLVCFILLLFLALSYDLAVAANKTVVVVNSYNRDFKWVKEHNGILKRGLSGVADVFCHYLDFKRLSKEQAERNVEAVKNILVEQKPTVVVLTDDYALKYLGQFLVDRDIPVVFLGINGNARGYVKNIRKITGVFERPLVKRSVAYLTEIVGPGKYLVLMDDSLSSRVFVQESLRGDQSFNVSGTHADILLIQNFRGWQEQVKAASDAGYSCIIIGTYHIFKDKQGNHIPSTEVIKWTSKHAPVPVFALWDFSVGQGKAVGGYVLSGIAQGREALRMVKRILAGEKTESIQPVIGKRGQLLFSGPEMTRWNITIPESLSSKGFQIKIIR